MLAAVVSVGLVVAGTVRVVGGEGESSTLETGGDGAEFAVVLRSGRDFAPGAIERVDPGAEAGPWTVTVRRGDGSLGRRGAVVTYPVEPPTTAAPTDLGEVSGWATPDAVVWVLDGSYARVRGDLSAEELLAIAAAVTVDRGRPVLEAPPGLRVVRSAPYRSRSVRELRYSTSQLGESAALGDGLTYSAVSDGGGFEDQLFGTERRFVHIGGREAVVSDVHGGNATVAWELANGDVAYVGYSGSELSDGAVDALARLVESSRTVDREQWAGFGAQRVEQVNGPIG
jgi:hypothetical protein